MLCQSKDLGLTSPTCQGGLHNIIEVMVICLSCGFSVATLFSVAQVRYFARYKEPSDAATYQCMPDIAEKIIALVSIAIRCSTFATPLLLAHERDINFASVSFILLGYIISVAFRGLSRQRQQQPPPQQKPGQQGKQVEQQKSYNVWLRPVRYLCSSLFWVCLIYGWKPIIEPYVADSRPLSVSLCLISTLILMGFTFNLLRRERQFLRYGCVAFIAFMVIGYGAYIVTVLAEPDTDLWPVALCSSAAGILYAALWTFFPGTSAPRTSYVTFHIASELCMLAPLPALLFVHSAEEVPLILLAMLTCYYLGRFLFLADLPAYNSRVVFYRFLLFCALAKFVSTAMSDGSDVTSLSVALRDVSDVKSLMAFMRVLTRVYAGPTIVFSFSVINVYQIARKQKSSGPNIFEQGALVACLAIYCVYVCGPAVVAGAVFVLKLREPKMVWNSYGPRMFGMGVDAVFGVVVCVAFAVFSIVNRSLIISNDRKRRREYFEQQKLQMEMKKTQ